ncbi:acid-sensing ion channel 1C-like [Lingula anatina]|uniref:Acid-sensing ion channel 1C-like n=1 Tax=Lingula anatina TaxID=7574 RepID=A0A1S3ISD7_LINAN|nr:acid-sensing ion channel 1C-like [Lingula anatina]|eukprot:XP_013400449.1 acid-sensing ion channel 1C-like [Lingula anatina]
MEHLVSLCGWPANVCTIAEVINCSLEVLERYHQERNHHCCRPPCKDTQYSVNLNSATYPADFSIGHLPDELPQDKPLEYLRKEYLELRIFYEELNFQRIEQIPVYTLEKLVGKYLYN